MNKTIQVGLIGYGMGGQLFHAPFIDAIDGLNLKKIRTTKPEQIELAKKRYPNVMVVSDVEEIFKDSSIELVVITTPNHLHFPIARKALMDEKHVVIDKPFTVSTAEADELIELAKIQGRILSVFQSRRFDSDFRTVQQVVGGGLLGNIVEIESRYDRFRNFLKPNVWKEEAIPGTGLLYDLGSHLIDQALTLFGPPSELTAFVNKQRAGTLIDDNFEIILHYPKIKATLKSGMLVREQLFRFALFGDQGIFVKRGMDVQEEALKAGFEPKSSPTWGIEPETIWGIIHTTTSRSTVNGTVESIPGDYRIYYKNIYDSIVTQVPLQVTAQQARQVIRIIELAFRSSEEKKTIPYED
ncbi:MAG TPA: Gfo/Idh/MocA family oxidoreductase [Puia sp.]|nr:Gfo/Idh/MocA family oxidoreductase [Puia sp.]